MEGSGYVPENRDIFPDLTARQNLILGFKDTRHPGKWRLEDMLQMFPNLAARADTAAGVLSSGEKQMLTISSMHGEGIEPPICPDLSKIVRRCPF